MKFPDSHRRFFWIDQCIVPAIINFVLNAGIAYLVLRSHAQLTIWGEAGVGFDLLITGFLLPFLTCVIVSQVIARQVRSGRVAALAPDDLVTRGLHTRPIALRAALLGGAGALVVALPTVFALDRWADVPFSLGTFVAFKGLWASALAVVVSPPIAWWTLQSASREPSSSAV